MNLEHVERVLRDRLEALRPAPGEATTRFFDTETTGLCAAVGTRAVQLYAQAGGIIWNEAVGIFPAELLNVYASRSIVSGLDLAPTMAPRLRTVTIK